MMKNKFLFINILLLLAVILCLAGCGKSEENEGARLEKQETEAEIENSEDDVSDAEEAAWQDISEEAPESDSKDDFVPKEPPESKGSFVLIQDYIPNVYMDLKYATDDNFTGKVIYDFNSAYLRYGTVEKLGRVSEELAKDGYALKIWDAFRPVSAQFKLWEICPDPTYVANPNNGYSSHSRGNTVDLTIVTLEGGEVEMPTGFDDFSQKADRDYSDCGKTEAENASYLENIMEKNGFEGYQGEWWHYSDTEEYPVEEEFCPVK